MCTMHAVPIHLPALLMLNADSLMFKFVKCGIYTLCKVPSIAFLILNLWARVYSYNHNMIFLYFLNHSYDLQKLWLPWRCDKKKLEM